MASYSSLSALFTAIADNIRAKLGSSEDIVAIDFPEKIAEIPNGVPTVNRYLTINRVDGRNVPSGIPLKVKYVFVKSSTSAWEQIVVDLDNGGSIQIPLPEPVYLMSSTNTAYKLWESQFQVFFYKGETEETLGLSINESKTTTDLIANEHNFSAYSTSERLSWANVSSYVADPTAVLTVGFFRHEA